MLGGWLPVSFGSSEALFEQLMTCSWACLAASGELQFLMRLAVKGFLRGLSIG